MINVSCVDHDPQPGCSIPQDAPHATTLPLLHSAVCEPLFEKICVTLHTASSDWTSVVSPPPAPTQQQILESSLSAQDATIWPAAFTAACLLFLSATPPTHPFRHPQCCVQSAPTLLLEPHATTLPLLHRAAYDLVFEKICITLHTESSDLTLAVLPPSA